MALHIFNEYDPRAVAPDASYPYGSFLNAQPGGTPLDYKFMNDVYGLLQKLLTEAGIIPNGLPDTVNTSQYYDAMAQVFGLSGGITNWVSLSIGAWDMDTVASVSIPHGQALANIKSCQVLIRNDANDNVRDITTSAGPISGAWNITTTNVVLTRTSGAFFDSTNYNDVLIDRGTILLGIG